MKVAVLGTSSLALETAKMYQEIGAHITLIGEKDFMNQGPKYSTKNARVKRIQKKFLNLGEGPLRGSRFSDLFRVVFETQVDVGEEEVYQNIDESMKEHLKEPLEGFLDVDLIVDLRGSRPLGMKGTNGPAINEGYYQSKGFLSYGERDLEDFGKLKNLKNIAFVGDHESLSNYLDVINFQELNNIFFIDCKNLNLGELEENDKADFENQINDFHEKMNAWKSLEDYEKVKVPRPLEPQRKLQRLENFSVVSIDHLTDQIQVFLSIEDREGNLKTLSCDHIIINQGTRDLSYPYLEKDEKGLLVVDSNLDHQEALKNLMNETEKLFTRSE